MQLWIGLFMTYHIITFGCQMNANDSEWLDRALRERGLKPAELGQAKIYILNTCSVREKPELKVYSLLGRLKAYWSRIRRSLWPWAVAVAQQIGKRFLERFPFVRLVFGGDGVSMAPQAIERLQENPGLRISLLDFSESYARASELRAATSGGSGTGFCEHHAGLRQFLRLLHCSLRTRTAEIPYQHGHPGGMPAAGGPRRRARSLCWGRMSTPTGWTRAAMASVSLPCCGRWRPFPEWSGCVSSRRTPKIFRRGHCGPSANCRNFVRSCICPCSRVRILFCVPWEGVMT